MKIDKKTVALISLLTICGFANAQSSDRTPLNSPTITGFLVDSEGHAVRVSDGSCVRTGSYDPVTAYHPECNPKIAQVTPPVVPAAPQPIAVKNEVKQSSTKVFFSFDSSVLSSNEKNKVDKFLSENNAKQVKIEAGTDFIGSNNYNKKLSERRAKTIADYVKTTSNVTVTEVVALGENNATKQNTDECKAVKNNRSELIKCIADDRSGTVTLVIN